MNELELLLARAKLLAEAPPVDDGDREELVVFEVHGQRHAVPIDAVQSVTEAAGITRIPGLPSFLPGVVSHRGRLSCVLELRELAGGSRAGIVDLPFFVFVQ